VNVAEIAKQWYEKNQPEGALAATILRCFFAGVIIRRPDFLLMGQTCWTEKGTMSSYDLCLEAPFALDFVAFKRRGKTKIIAWEQLYNRDIYYGRSTVSTNP
jgi:hypothetical protein